MNITPGARIKALREARKLTLEQLAISIGSSKNYMWEIENKETSRPSAAMLDKLSRAFGVGIEEIMYGTKSADAQDKAILRAGTEDKVFFREYQELPDPDKDRLRRILQALKSPK
ncbi:MAG: helix-turn-helix transcriptional regulator [Synechococcaceae cyanobacterium SM1_2_3]|nr:helix-turn-helix transcriptional regulator [Synechococcaceae cyanobacterium SM1_2_3]